jgi:endonuclease/exonuclease/phosphatase family metal-dependent hydrolase
LSHPRWLHQIATAVLTAALVLVAPMAGATGGSTRSPLAAPAAVDTIRLSVMSLNIFYGGDDYDLRSRDWCPVADGCPQGLRKLARVVEASGADVVGVQEAERNTRALAKVLGWHADERAHVISRYPLLPPAGGQGLYTYVEPRPGRIVAVANTHLPSTPYGPYKVQRGWSAESVLELERSVRVPALAQVLRELPGLAARGIPVFLTGDFNSPSHLDWTQAVADARADVPYPVAWPASATLAEAGFEDSYRVVHPDPVADPGFTWTPGGPEAREDDVFDRIDWVLSAGPATAVSSSVVGEAANPQVEMGFPGTFPTDHRGVVSTFDVTPQEAPPIVSPSQRRVLVDEDSRLRVRFHGTGSAAEVVAIVPRPGPSGRRLAAKPTRGRTSGAVVLPTSRLTSGRYDVVLRDTATGRTSARSPIWVYEPGTPARVATGADSYRADEPVVVSWIGAPGQHLDWVGLYRCRRTCDDPGSYVAYRYTRTRIAGVLTFSGRELPGESSSLWPLPPGEYVARLLVDDSYRMVAMSPRFEVVAR